MNNFLLYAVTVLIWGTTWITINYQLGTVAPEVSLAYRFGLAATLLMFFCLLSRRSLRFGGSAHLAFVAMGLLMFGLNYIFAYKAQFHINSAFNALVFASMVWLNIMFTRLFFGTRSDKTVYLGAAMGMLGVGILLWPEVGNLSLSDATLLGAAISFAGAMSASLGNMVSQRSQQKGLPVVQSNAWGMLYGCLFYVVWALLTQATWNFEMSATYVGSLLYLTIFGTVIGFGCYLTLLGRIGAHKAGYAVVMFPVVAVLFSVALEGLRLSPHLLTGLALVLAGNIVILRRPALPA